MGKKIMRVTKNVFVILVFLGVFLLSLSGCGSTTTINCSYPSIAPFIQSPVIHNGIAYVTGRYGTVYALNSLTGVLVWQRILSKTFLSQPFVLGNDVFVGSKENKVIALDTKDGSVMWKVPNPFDPNVTAFPSFISGSQDSVFVLTPNQGVESYKASDGTLLWGHPIRNVRGIFPPLYYANRVYVLGGDIYAFDSANGTVIWSIPGEDGKNYTQPTINNQTLFVSKISNAQDNVLVEAIDIHKGSVLWMNTLRGQKGSSVSAWNNQIYIVVVNAESNEQVSTLYTLGNDGSMSKKTLLHGNLPRLDTAQNAVFDAHNIYIALDLGKVEKLDPLIDRTVWSHAVTSHPIVLNPIVNDSVIGSILGYDVQSCNRQGQQVDVGVFSLKASDGSINWLDLLTSTMRR